MGTLLVLLVTVIGLLVIKNSLLASLGNSKVKHLQPDQTFIYTQERDLLMTSNRTFTPRASFQSQLFRRNVNKLTKNTIFISDAHIQSAPYYLSYIYTMYNYALNKMNTPKDDAMVVMDDGLVGDDSDDDDDDGNSPICHKIPIYKGDKCQFSKDHCPTPLAGGFINYIQMRYCTFLDKVPFLYYVVVGIWIIILFYLLGDTADANFCPSLTEISRLLRLPPDVAGVTFLAFGNGAPDIASILAGFISNSAGFGIGEPIGAGLFVNSVVKAAVVIFSNVIASPLPFFRDALTYGLSVVFVFIVTLTDTFEIWQSLICLLIYFIYVSFVVFYRIFVTIVVYIHRKRRGAGANERSRIMDEVTRKYTESDDEGDLEFYYHKDKKPRFDMAIKNIEDLKDSPLPDIVKENITSFYGPKSGVIKEEDVIINSDEKRELKDGEVVETDGNKGFGSLVIEEHFYEDNEEDEYSDHSTAQSSKKNPLLKIIYYFADWIEWNDKNWFDRILFIITSPTILVRNLTVPKADPDEWSKFFAVLNPIFIPWFTLWAIQYGGITIPKTPVPIGAILTIFGLFVSIFILCTSKVGRKPIYHPIIVIISFIMGIIWIYIEANELVDVLQSIGVIWSVSDAILAVTVLTWGNSLGDLVADVMIARRESPQMALSAILGGPCLNLLIGIGLSVTYSCIRDGKGFDLGQIEPTVFLSFILLLLILVLDLVLVPLFKFRIPKLYGFLLTGIYAFFMVSAILMEADLLFPILE